MNWDVAHTICGIDELPRHARSGPAQVVSILDPDCPSPHALGGVESDDRLVLRFHDIIAPAKGKIPPRPGHVELLLAFSRHRARRRQRRLLVHCHAGISRSTAAAAVLMLHEQPDADEDALFDHIGRLRPQAWPNSRIIAYADEILGREGRLVQALGRFYGRVLRAEPDLACRLRMAGRGAEVDMADLGHNVAPLRFFGMWRKGGSGVRAAPAPGLRRQYG